MDGENIGSLFPEVTQEKTKSTSDVAVRFKRTPSEKSNMPGVASDKAEWTEVCEFFGVETPTQLKIRIGQMIAAHKTGKLVIDLRE